MIKHSSIRRHPKPKTERMCSHPLSLPIRDTKQRHQWDIRGICHLGPHRCISCGFPWQVCHLAAERYCGTFERLRPMISSQEAWVGARVLSFCTIRPDPILPGLWLGTGRFMERHSYSPHIAPSDLHFFRAPKKYLASNLQQTLTWSKLSPPVHTHVTFILHRDTNCDALISIVTMLMSGVYHLRPMCQVYMNSEQSSRHFFC